MHYEPWYYVEGGIVSKRAERFGQHPADEVARCSSEEDAKLIAQAQNMLELLLMIKSRACYDPSKSVWRVRACGFDMQDRINRIIEAVK